jgi:hypothetical protein
MIGVKITKKEVDVVFEGSEYVVALHKLVVEKAGLVWDDIDQLDQFLKCSRKTNLDLTRRAIAFDQEHNRGGFPGGSWLNWGFSTSEDLPDYLVTIDETKIVYKRTWAEEAL